MPSFLPVPPAPAARRGRAASRRGRCRPATPTPSQDAAPHDGEAGHAGDRRLDRARPGRGARRAYCGRPPPQPLHAGGDRRSAAPGQPARSARARAAARRRRAAAPPPPPNRPSEARSRTSRRRAASQVRPLARRSSVAALTGVPLARRRRGPRTRQRGERSARTGARDQRDAGVSTWPGSAAAAGTTSAQQPGRGRRRHGEHDRVDVTPRAPAPGRATSRQPVGAASSARTVDARPDVDAAARPAATPARAAGGRRPPSSPANTGPGARLARPSPPARRAAASSEPPRPGRARTARAASRAATGRRPARRRRRRAAGRRAGRRRSSRTARRSRPPRRRRRPSSSGGRAASARRRPADPPGTAGRRARGPAGHPQQRAGRQRHSRPPARTAAPPGHRVDDVGRRAELDEQRRAPPAGARGTTPRPTSKGSPPSSTDAELAAEPRRAAPAR